MKFWINMPEGVLKTARTRMGLSMEAVARRLDISAKTYERWERASKVDGAYVQRLSAILDLEIKLPEKAQVILENHDIEITRAPTMAEIAERLEAIQTVMEEILRNQQRNLGADLESPDDIQAVGRLG